MKRKALKNIPKPDERQISYLLRQENGNIRNAKKKA